MGDDAVTDEAPARPGRVLLTLILVAAVANLNLAVANVALPSIGDAFDASQTQLNLVAVGYSLGLASSVLYLGALGDRHGRKMMLVLGTALALPVSVVAAWAPSVEVLVAARLVGGLAAGMAFPTTLALISALWSGAGRTRAIALWSGLGGAVSALGPVVAGGLLEGFWWGSVFLVTLPLAVLALVLSVAWLPSHVHEATEPVDNLGGVLSVVAVAALVMAINLVAEPDRTVSAVALGLLAVAAGTGFFLRQRRARNPLYDLHVAARPTFWVAGLAGIIVFGSLMGAMFIGQQFLQNVLGYSTLEAGAAILPAAALMVVVAPRSAKLVESHGSRFVLLLGYAFCLLAFLVMLVLWEDGSHYASVALAYAVLGIGVGLAGTPASRALTGAVPVARAGMASATADLQRDLGGAILQSILGALLGAGYASSMRATVADAPSSVQEQVTDSIQGQLTKSFGSAEALAARYPQYQVQIVDAARESFVSGQDWAYLAGIVAVLVGAVLVWRCFPDHEAEVRDLAAYAAADPARAPGVGADRDAPPTPTS